ncbi:hypothetical protein A9G45_09605 [Gilliamella sp. HK2]|uniref:hypothetical protein n=1 Tax=unclassified Gilliamella TaxID=2685620 RepID=UPI00080E6DFE|nr:hypothetical protein [Gilliamella apicola]OCG27176.1 hypothetical protein A9G45_09605 [Gilliamella apicola]OCG29270.1 hypothetical protein A9G46_00885 [Gilliamella apicola]
MKIYFSGSTMGFYFDVIHTNIPDDVVEITQSEYQSLLEKQSTGYEIIIDKDGKPTAKKVER